MFVYMLQFSGNNITIERILIAPEKCLIEFYISCFESVYSVKQKARYL